MTHQSHKNLLTRNQKLLSPIITTVSNATVQTEARIIALHLLQNENAAG